jgi:hypothetical protein
MQPQPESLVVIQAVETPAETGSETTLAQEIAQLWSVHSQAESVLGRTKKELRALRFDLGRRLYEMKLLLACPGRAGQWRKFLSAQRIPRASADRWAKMYGRTLDPSGEIASTEATTDSVEGIVQKALRGALPKLGQVLANEETAYQFMCALAQRCETLHAEFTELGITVLKPTAGNLHCGLLRLVAKNAGEEIAPGSNQVTVAEALSPA